jgi:hypothetical protein
MTLTMEHITASSCTECGCTEVRKFEKSNKNCSGQWNERLTFEFGLMLHYSPNFSRVDQEGAGAPADDGLVQAEHGHPGAGGVQASLGLGDFGTGARDERVSDSG